MSADAAGGSFRPGEVRGADAGVPGARDADVREAVAGAARDERAAVVATLIRVTGDWDLAEECAQDALAKALVDWPRTGVPRVPGAWLTTVARNRAIDRLRRARVERRLLQGIADEPADAEPAADTAADDLFGDDRLRLVFTCCHPALSPDARVALTLRTVAGLSTADIARSFLVTEETIRKRLVRARAKIRAAAIPYRVPPRELLPERTAGVLAVVYLLFTRGYAASGDRLLRVDLMAEAVRLGRLLLALLGESPEVLGLVALMLLQGSRSAARTDAAGDPVTLEHQDRALWDRDAILEGTRLIDRAEVLLARGGERPGPYLLQAGIACLHATAPSVEHTDTTAIVRLYDALLALTPSPVIELNRAIAIAMADGPAVALPLVEALDAAGALAAYPPLPATRADLLRRLGRADEAAVHYRRALDIAPSDAERRHVSRRLEELGGG